MATCFHRVKDRNERGLCGCTWLALPGWRWPRPHRGAICLGSALHAEGGGRGWRGCARRRKGPECHREAGTNERKRWRARGRLARCGLPTGLDYGIVLKAAAAANRSCSCLDRWRNSAMHVADWVRAATALLSSGILASGLVDCADGVAPGRRLCAPRPSTHARGGTGHNPPRMPLLP